MKTCRTGIIGFGFMGRVRAHSHLNLPLFYDPPPLLAPIVTVCSASRQSAEKGAALLGARAVTDYRQVTEDPAIDIVHICTPNHLHAEAILSAIAHGKHIYCDKPLTATMEEALAVEAALAGYTGTSQMTFQNRFFPAMMRARQLIDEGLLGEPLQFRVAYLHGGSADPRAPLKWKLSGSAGGGVIADLGSHALDAVGFLLGEFEQVQAATKIAYAQRPAAADPSRMVGVDAEDLVVLLARMRCGALGTIEATKLATGSEDELRIEVHGSAGALRFNTVDPHHLEVYDAGAADRPIGGRRGWTAIDTGQRYEPPASAFPGPKFAIGWLRAHLACLANFLYCVAEDRPAQPDLAHGVAIQRLLECCRESARTGQWVRVEQ